MVCTAVYHSVPPIFYNPECPVVKLFISFCHLVPTWQNIWLKICRKHLLDIFWSPWGLADHPLHHKCSRHASRLFIYYVGRKTRIGWWRKRYGGKRCWCDYLRCHQRYASQWSLLGSLLALWSFRSWFKICRKQLLVIFWSPWGTSALRISVELAWQPLGLMIVRSWLKICRKQLLVIFWSPWGLADHPLHHKCSRQGWPTSKRLLPTLRLKRARKCRWHWSRSCLPTGVSAESGVGAKILQLSVCLTENCRSLAPTLGRTDLAEEPARTKGFKPASSLVQRQVASLQHQMVSYTWSPAGLHHPKLLKDGEKMATAMWANLIM